MRIVEIITHKKLGEQATAGATSAGSIATVVSPHIAIGPDRFKKSYTGTPENRVQKHQTYPKLKNKHPKTMHWT